MPGLVRIPRLLLTMPLAGLLLMAAGGALAVPTLGFREEWPGTSIQGWGGGSNHGGGGSNRGGGGWGHGGSPDDFGGGGRPGGNAGGR